MNWDLNPNVVKKLQAFSSRRRWLLILRGLSAGVITFVLLMSIIAVIDWRWLLSDEARWGMTAVAYALVAGTVWWTSLRWLWKQPARTELASHFETLAPEMKEKLLSAVELAVDDPSEIHDSPQFRSLLQGEVSEQIEKIKVPRLLPLKRVAGWVCSAIVLVAVIVSILSYGDVRVRQLAARAVWPGANIARVSRIQVAILEPTPHELMLPENETVAVVVAVSGGIVNDATVEVFTSEGTRRLPMRGRTEAEFAVNLNVKEAEIEYRVLAGDAITKKYRIQSRPRPSVVAFEKTFEYPAYTQLPPVTKSEDHGDLIALSGTKTRLSLELNQEVKEAELRIDPLDSDETARIPLTQNDNGIWSASVPIDENAVYKVHLVSKETGFENTFSRRHEIRPVSDLVPRVGFLDQEEQTQLLPPNDILAMRGMAEDDLPIHQLEQHISVNGREWIKVPLDTTEAKQDSETESNSNASKRIRDESPLGSHRVNSSWQWDLLKHKLKSGDQIITKLVATDLKGHVGESVPLQIIVAAPEFDSERHAAMEAKSSLISDFRDLAEIFKQHKEQADEAIQRLQAADRTEEQISTDHALLTDLSRQQTAASKKLNAKLIEVLRKMPAGADADDVDRAGQLLAHLQLDTANDSLSQVTVLGMQTDAKEAKKSLNEIKKTFQRSADTSKILADHYQTLTAQNILNAFAVDFDALYRQQKIVVDSSLDSWDRLTRQQTVSLSQMKLLEELMIKKMSSLPKHIQGHVKREIDWLIRYRDLIEQASESEEKIAELRQRAQQFHNELQHHQRMSVIDGGLPNRLKSSRRDLANRARGLFEPIMQSVSTIREEEKKLADVVNAEDSTKIEERQSTAAIQTARIELFHRKQFDQLRERRNLIETRQDANSQQAADYGLTHRAVTSLLNLRHDTEDVNAEIVTPLNEISKALRILESGHELIATHRAISALTQNERWNSQSLATRLDSPRQWDLIASGFESSSQHIREAGVDREIHQKVDQVRWSGDVGKANAKISERRWKWERLVSSDTELIKVRTDTEEAIELMDPVMVEARAIIAKYAPTIPEMARQAADALRAAEAQSVDAADAIEQETEDGEEAVAEVAEQQEQINQQLDDLVEALIEDANRRDTLDEEERERARDADDSIALVQENAEMLDRAIDDAMQAQEATAQAEELSETAEQQEKSADALEMIAEHFERLEEDQNIAETREQLRQAERDLGIARQMEQMFEPSEELASLTDSTMQNLLEQLEEELERNPAMQKALSEISEQTLDEAQSALERAAEQDQRLQRDLERADAEFFEKKRQMVIDLKELGQEAAQISNAMLNQARSAAQQGKVDEAKKQLEESQRKLNEAAQKANGVNEDQLLEDIAAVAQEAQAAVAEAKKQIAEAEKAVAKAENEKIFEQDRDRENQKKNLERSRKQVRDQEKRTARDQAKRADDAVRRADQAVKNAENRVKQEQRNVDNAKKQADQKPEDGNRQRNLENAEARRDQRQQEADIAKQRQQHEQQKRDRAKQREKEANAKQQPALNAPNPAAELAQEYTQDAQKRAEALEKRLAELAKSKDQADELTPPQQNIANAANTQNDVTQEVEETAENIARAARHERRLKNEMAATPLLERAEQIQKVADEEATKAGEKLTATAEAMQPKATGKPAENNNKGVAEAQDALERSEDAIAEQAQQLSEEVEAMRADESEADSAEPNDEPGNPEPGNPENGNPENGNPENGTPMNPPGSPEAGTPESGQPNSPTENNAAGTPMPAGENRPASGTEDPMPHSGGQPAQGQPPGQGEPMPANAPAGEGQPTAPITPEEQEIGRLLAQTLDELDRHMNSGEPGSLANMPALPNSNPTDPAAGNPPTEPDRAAPSPAESGPTPPSLDSLAQAAQASQSKIAQSRRQSRQRATAAEGFNPEGDPSLEGTLPDFDVAAVDRNKKANWGKLRESGAEDISQGKSEAVSEDYRQSVEAYFRVLAERARRKK